MLVFGEVLCQKMFFQTFALPDMTKEELMLSKLMENCGFKSTVAAIAGFGLGIVFGLFTASVDPQATMAFGADRTKIVSFSCINSIADL